jgi:hypothetical protein
MSVLENGHMGEIVLYQPDNLIRLEVRLEDETVWLNRHQPAELFDRDVKTIGKHINNALKEELSDDFSVVADFATTDRSPTVVKFATVQTESGKNPVVANFATTAKFIR